DHRCPPALTRENAGATGVHRCRRPNRPTRAGARARVPVVTRPSGAGPRVGLFGRRPWSFEPRRGPWHGLPQPVLGPGPVWLGSLPPPRAGLVPARPAARAQL